MLNKQEIINQARIKLGNSPQNSINDDYFITSYNAGKQFLLSKHYWRFAKTIVQLSLNSDITIEGWEYVYRLPTNVGCIYDTVPHSEYNIFGSNLVSNRNPISLEYSSNDVGDSFPAEFALLLSCWIAREVSGVVLKNTSLYQQLDAQYKEAFLDAVSTDSASISSLKIRQNRYIDIRG